MRRSLRRPLSLSVGRTLKVVSEFSDSECERGHFAASPSGYGIPMPMAAKSGCLGSLATGFQCPWRRRVAVSDLLRRRVAVSDLLRRRVAVSDLFHQKPQSQPPTISKGFPVAEQGSGLQVRLDLIIHSELYGGYQHPRPRFDRKRLHTQSCVVHH